jgi:exopolysaccharide biosynthesis polyprenyl glycosylphosphotransferase
MAIKYSPSKRMQYVWNICLIIALIVSVPLAYFAYHYILFSGEALLTDIEVGYLIVVWATSFVIKVAIESIFDNFNLSKEILSSFTNTFFASLLGTIIGFFIGNAIYEHVDYIALSLIDFIIYFLLAVIIRYGVYISLSKQKRKIMIIGPVEEAKTLAKKFLFNKHSNRVIKFIFFINNGDEMPKGLHTSIKKSHEVFLTHGLSNKIKDHIVLYCIANRDIDVFVVPTSYEIGIYAANESNADDVLTFKARELRLSLWQKIVKRCFDVFCSVVGLLIAWPLMLITAMIIRTQDGGPAIFRQERVTVNDETFTLYKFRSMTIDAEKNTGAVLASKEDPRITKFGKFIRSTRIDELPQLWNVLLGDMSFVGPRPERVAFVNEFLKETPEYRYRSNVKAGITGLAQTKGRYDTKYQDKLRWDLLYIRNYSFIGDIKIILRTILAVFSKTSAQGIDCSRELEDILASEGKKIVKEDHYWEIV